MKYMNVKNVPLKSYYQLLNKKYNRFWNTNQNK